MSNTSPVANALKVYFFPSLVTIVAMLIWRDVTELRTDVKSLLAQSNIDKTRIDALQRQVDVLNQTILHGEPTLPSKPISSSTFSAKEFITFNEKKKKKYVRWA
jgi:hypothetical protein